MTTMVTPVTTVVCRGNFANNGHFYNILGPFIQHKYIIDYIHTLKKLSVHKATPIYYLQTFYQANQQIFRLSDDLKIVRLPPENEMICRTFV